jgi:hypothetical protein
VRLDPLYRITFRYPEAYRGADELLLIAQGRVEGARVSGRFRGANRARRRDDGTFLPDLSGAIVTEDGANVLVRLTGYGHPEGDPGRVLAALTHSTADERYAWLNEVLGVVAGEVRGGRRRRLAGADHQEGRALPVTPSAPTGRRERGSQVGVEIVLDVAQLVWEPLRDTIDP